MNLVDLASILPLGDAWLIKVFLLSIRIGAALLLTPILAAGSVPTVVRVLLVIGLAIALSAALPAADPAVPPVLPPMGLDHPGALIQAAAIELALGLTLAAGIHLAFASFAVAGRLIDIQIGFGLAQVLDPASKAELPILTTIFNQIGVLVFFLVNGHQAVLRGIAYSLQRFPPGRPWSPDLAYAPIMAQLGGVFSLAFALTAPVVFSVFMAEIALGILARNLPQINMLTLGIPVKIVIGLVVLSLWFAGIGSVMTRVYAGIYQSWTAIFAAKDAADAPMERQ